MLVLILVGFLGGVVTGISPCILPVLPVIFAAGAASGLDGVPEPMPSPPPEGAPEPAPVGAGGVTTTRPDGAAVVAVGPRPRPPTRRTLGKGADRHRRPLAVVGGLVMSFAVFTLTGSWLLTALGLPQDLLEKIGLVILAVVGLGLIVPAIGDALERPFARVAGRQRTGSGGFVLGVSLGLVFVPCAGPVLTAIAVVSANHRYGLSSLVLTAAFALGIAVPLLVFAVLGQRLAERLPQVRRRAAVARRVIGVVLMATALVIALHGTDGLQRALPGYTNALQNSIEGNASATQALARVKGTGAGVLADCSPGSATLQECGVAPSFAGISAWLNTPDDKPLTLAGLSGRVVLVDFWTYSCINCQRTLPHLEAWNRAYGKDGLTVIGVHTPEFAFEHVLSNVSQAAGQLGVRYPIALDDAYDTWNAYGNNYWPAEYLIDGSGHVRHVDFGEGRYGQTETFIRNLLTAADPAVALPPRTDIPDATPTEATTPETYLGYQHGTQDLVGQTPVEDQMGDYTVPTTLPTNGYAYGGRWSIGAEASTAGPGATLRLEFVARHVYLVLGGSGTVTVSVNGAVPRVVAVGGEPKLYQLVDSSTVVAGGLSLSVTPGVKAYDFTFG